MNNMGREIMAALKRFQVGSDGDGVTVGGALVVSGATTVNTFNVDVISEKTSAAGVTVDGVLLKDSGVVVADGSASAPTVTNTGDTNTGLYFPAADEVAVAAGGSVAAAFNSHQFMGMRNRIINGDMRIDQRNAGASVTAFTSYTVDRFQKVTSGAAQSSFQQVADAPNGFVNSLKFTVTSTDASTTVYIKQAIEGFNTADFMFGTANAKTVTLSFWVKSSVTGTYSVVFINSAFNRSYVTTYSISSADTWEYKTITVAGDTTGTWLANNGIGVELRFAIASGGTTQTTGLWGTANAFCASTQTNWANNSGATFYITGVQLEVGSVATPFERRPYGTELALCQRYYYLFASGNNANLGVGGYYNSTYVTTTATFPVTMRAAPSLVQTTGTNYYRIFANNASDNFDSFNEGIQQPTVNTAGLDCSSGVSGTAGHVGRIITNNASASIAFNSEL
jgi:hypothetical protein